MYKTEDAYSKFPKTDKEINAVALDIKLEQLMDFDESIRPASDTGESPPPLPPRPTSTP
ncbi:hypothetical protein TWF694_008523 [Orbilia ellipsospora]|uniref:Uncharacterized protein n=1 Tax=Orbilia ellipsospora TaxID=2528407 RepID=A0AAV9XHR4_9PEZI